MERKQVEAEIKKHCIPLLRKHRFKGAYPNLHKEQNGFVCLVNFQFYSAGGSFCVNLGYADAARENVDYRPETEVAKLLVSQTRNRARLGGHDNWFSFGSTTYGELRGEPIPIAEIVRTVNGLIETEAMSWWEEKRAASQC